MQANPVPTPDDRQQVAQAMLRADLQRRVKSGASNFFWIAGLSIVNSAVGLFGGSVYFLIGLALTQVIDALAGALAVEAASLATAFKVIGFVLDLGIAGVFVLFGFLARKEKRWAFIAGMVLYALDAGLALLFQDYLGFGFHIFFLWLAFNGLKALTKLHALFPEAVTEPVFSKELRF